MEQQYTGKATDYVQGECKVLATVVKDEPMWDISDEKAYDKAMDGNNGYDKLMQIGEEMQRQMGVTDPHKRVDVQLVQPTGMFAKPEVVIAIYDDRVSDTKAVDAFVLKDKPMNNTERFWSNWTNYNPIETLYDNNSERFNLPFTVESADGDKTHIMRLESVVDELRGEFMIAREQRHKEIQAELDAQGQAFEENLGITAFGNALLEPVELNNIIGRIEDGMRTAESVREKMDEIQSEFGGSMAEFLENRGSYQTAVLLAVQSDPVLSGTIPENADNAPRLDVKQDIYGKDDVDRWDLGTGGYPVMSDQRQYMACAEIQVPVFNENGEFVESNNTKVYFYDKDVFVGGAKTLDEAPHDHEGVVVLGAMFSQNLSVSEEQPFIAIDECGVDRTQEMMSYLKLSEKVREIGDREQENFKSFDKEVSEQVKATEKEQTKTPKKNNMAVQGM